MEYHLKKCERETVVLLNDADKTASISTSQRWMQRRLEELAKSHPDDVKITQRDKYTLFVEVPYKWVKIRPPRQISEEQREKAAERLRTYRNGKIQAESELDDEELDMDEDLDSDYDEETEEFEDDEE